MPDGTQLDFAEGGDYRGTDHRAIGAAYKGTAEHQWQYLQDFENRGGIRIHMNRDGKYGTIEMAVKPTAEQKKKLRSFINAVGGNVDIDFMDENYNTTHSVSYEGVSPTRALSGITTFYDKGIKPKGNVSYSVVREGFVEGNEKSGVYEIDTDTMYGGEYGTLLKERYEIKDGERNGAYSFVWDLGYRGEGQFKDGKAEGIFTEYFADGSKASETTYKNGLREGKAWRKMGGEIIETTYYGDITESQWKDIDRMRSILRNTEEQGVSYSLNRLPKEEYKVLSSEIFRQQHIDKKPRFYYAYTANNVYLYNYFGDGFAMINFAVPLEGNQDLTNLIIEQVKNGTIDSTISLNTFLERARSRRSGYPRHITDVIKKRRRNRGFYISIPRGESEDSSGVASVGRGVSGVSTTRGKNRRSNESRNQTITESHSLNRTDIDYLDAVNRGDMATAQNDDIRYSINRDDIATPEMEAEANKELTESQKAAKAIADEIEKRIKKIAEKKELTFEQIEQLMLDEKDDTSAIRRLVYIYNQAQGSKPKKTQAEADAAVEELKNKYELTIEEAKKIAKSKGIAYTAMREGTVKKKCRAKRSALSLVGEATYFSGRITMYAILLSAKTLAARALISS